MKNYILIFFCFLLINCTYNKNNSSQKIKNIVNPGRSSMDLSINYTFDEYINLLSKKNILNKFPDINDFPD